MKKVLKKRRPAVLVRLTESDLARLHEHCAGLATPVEAWCRRQILQGIRLQSDIPAHPNEKFAALVHKEPRKGLTRKGTVGKVRKSRQV